MAAKKSTKTAAVGAEQAATTVQISAPRFGIIHIPIIGDGKLVSNKFSSYAREDMESDMTATAAQKKEKAARIKKEGRPPKDFQKEYEGSLHRDPSNGKYGISCMAVKAAMVRACKAVGIIMTDAKMFVDVVPDGYNDEGQPLFYITKGEPHMVKHHVRNSNGSVDIRARGMFDEGWEATITLRYDKDLINEEHVVNLLQRAGLQVGIGAGRQFSSNSVGMGWGSFDIKHAKRQSEAAE